MEKPAQFGCGLCKFFFQYTGEVYGECRRGAPVAAPNGVAVWPCVQAVDWCGAGRKAEAA
jgi:hypothetical protein